MEKQISESDLKNFIGCNAILKSCGKCSGLDFCRIAKLSSEGHQTIFSLKGE